MQMSEFLFDFRLFIMTDTLKLKDYDLVSFDLDGTLCEYNTFNFYQSQYKFIIDYLLHFKHYQHLSTSLSARDLRFISKGLFIDYERGNLLKLSKNGVILRASFGSKMLSENVIEDLYGHGRTWPIFEGVVLDPFNLLSRQYLKKMLPLSDFSSAVLSVVYAKVIDATRDSDKTIIQVNKDVKEAFNSIYDPIHGWTSEFVKKLTKYTYKQDDAVIKWLRMLKSVAHTSLITSTDKTLAQKIAARALGNNWKDLFHFMVYSSQKPYFFFKSKPFFPLELSNPISFTMSGEYRYGSFQEIEQAFATKLGRTPRMIYFGDNPINDLVAAPEAVAIIAESGSENLIPLFRGHKSYVGDTWGSYFYEQDSPTWFGNIVLRTKFCAPSLTYFSRVPLNYEFTKFNH